MTHFTHVNETTCSSIAPIDMDCLSQAAAPLVAALLQSNLQCYAYLNGITTVASSQGQQASLSSPAKSPNSSFELSPMLLLLLPAPSSLKTAAFHRTGSALKITLEKSTRGFETYLVEVRQLKRRVGSTTSDLALATPFHTSCPLFRGTFFKFRSIFCFHSSLQHS